MVLAIIVPVGNDREVEHMKGPIEGVAIIPYASARTPIKVCSEMEDS